MRINQYSIWKVKSPVISREPSAFTKKLRMRYTIRDIFSGLLEGRCSFRSQKLRNDDKFRLDGLSLEDAISVKNGVGEKRAIIADPFSQKTITSSEENAAGI